MESDLLTLLSNMEQIPFIAAVINLELAALRPRMDFLVSQQIPVVTVAYLESAVLRSFLNRMINHDMQYAGL